jgi:hypothetical protein
VHKVDIFGEAGYGNVLHKWTTFDLKEDVIYLNKTYVYFLISSQHSMLISIRRDYLKSHFKR